MDSAPPIIIYENALSRRKELGDRWLDEREREVSRIEKDDDVSAANLLHSRIVQFPPYLSGGQKVQALSLSKKVENHLKKLKIDWLVERFNELDDEAKGIFVRIIGQRISSPSLIGSHLGD